jgi:hypothetical protein
MAFRRSDQFPRRRRVRGADWESAARHDRACARGRARSGPYAAGPGPHAWTGTFAAPRFDGNRAARDDEPRTRRTDCARRRA